MNEYALNLHLEPLLQVHIVVIVVNVNVKRESKQNQSGCPGNGSIVYSFEIAGSFPRNCAPSPEHLQKCDSKFTFTKSNTISLLPRTEICIRSNIFALYNSRNKSSCTNKTQHVHHPNALLMVFLDIPYHEMLTKVPILLFSNAV